MSFCVYNEAVLVFEAGGAGIAGADSAPGAGDSAGKQGGSAGKQSNSAAGSGKRRSGESVFGRIIGFVSAAVTPLIPGLVAGGMLKVFPPRLPVITLSAAANSSFVLGSWE